MGEQAYYTIMEIFEAENQRDNYVEGRVGLKESLERGMVGVDGVEEEGVSDAWDRSKIGTTEQIDMSIAKLKLQFK